MLLFKRLVIQFSSFGFSTPNEQYFLVIYAIAPATNELGMFAMCEAGDPKENAEAAVGMDPGWWWWG